MRKTISTILAIALVLSLMVGIFTFPSTAATTSGTCGSNLRWSFTGGGGLTISGTGDMTNYSSSTNVPWYSLRDRIFFLTIESGVTSIGSNAFAGCSKISGDIVLPDGLKRIGYNAFNSVAARSISIPDSVETLVQKAFSFCENITEIYIPKNVVEIPESLFFGCTNLSTIHMHERITSIGPSAFGGCAVDNAFVEQVLSLLAESGKIPRSLFSRNKNITAVVIPDGISEIGDYAFSACTNLIDVRFPNNAIKIGNGSFGNCGFKRVVLPETVVDIGENAFADCTKLAVASIPSSVKEIGEGIFARCLSLTELSVPAEFAMKKNYSRPTDSYREKNHIAPFFGCGQSSNLAGYYEKTMHATASGSQVIYYIPNKLTAIHITGNGDFSLSGLSKVTDVTLDEGVSKISTGAFSGCSALSKIIIPRSVTEVGIYPGFPRENFVIYGHRNSYAETYAQENGYRFEILTWETDGYKYQKNADGSITIVGYTGNDTRVTVPDTLDGLSVSTIAASTFQNNTDLSAIVLSSGISIIEPLAFSGCTGLRSVGLPDTITEIGEGAFSNNTRLNSITIPEGVSEIRKNTFDGCSNLKKVTLPKTLKTIEDGAFSDCSGLQDVTLPEKLERIDDFAFFYCTGLTQITIPRSVTEIGKYAFDGCDDFTTIYGYRNSYAEAYARENGYTFIPLSDPGDMDGDGVLSDEDAVYLLYHIYFPDDYPTSQNCDFDGDGAVTDADAAYLLYHIYFPEDYPLH